MNEIIAKLTWCGLLLGTVLASLASIAPAEEFTSFAQFQGKKEALNDQVFWQKDSLTTKDPFDFYRKNRHAKVYKTMLYSGMMYTIQLYGTFNTYLRLEDENGKILKENDDWLDNRTSLIQFKVPGTYDNLRTKQLYRIIVTSSGEGETGQFTLRVFQGNKKELVP